MRGVVCQLALAILYTVLLVTLRADAPHGANPQAVLQQSLRVAGTACYGARQVWRYRTDDGRTSSCEAPRWAHHAVPQDGRLRQNYTPLIEGEDVVAGRPAWTLRLKPSVKHRPWRQLWVDKRTGVVLAMRGWDHADRQKMSMETLFVLPPPRVPPVSTPARTKTIIAPQQQPHYIPAGYTLYTTSPAPAPYRSQLVYSDGLDSISVFLGFPDKQGREQKDVARVCGWGQGLVLTQGTTAVVGDLPVEVMSKIARSVR